MKISLLVAGLVAIGALDTHATAQSSEAISLPSILAAVDAAQGQDSIDKATRDWSAAAYEAAEQDLGRWAVELESTLGEKKDDVEAERRVGAFLERSMRLGANREAMRQQFDAEALALSLESRADALQQKMFAGRLYVHLLHHKRIALASAEMLATLSPLLTNAERGSGQGGADALTLLKWRILKDEITSARESALASYTMVATQLNALVGLSIATTPESAGLLDPDFASARAATAALSVRAQELQAQSDAWANKAKAAESGFALSGGLGVERDTTSDSNALIARISLPLGQGSIANAVAKEALAQSALAQQRAKLATRTFESELRDAQSKYDLGSDKAKALRARRENGKKLFDLTKDGLRTGLTDLAQLMEISETLFSLESELSEAIRETQDEGVALLVLSGGK